MKTSPNENETSTGRDGTVRCSKVQHSIPCCRGSSTRLVEVDVAVVVVVHVLEPRQVAIRQPGVSPLVLVHILVELRTRLTRLTWRKRTKNQNYTSEKV